MAATAVRVALRVRPLSAKEIAAHNRECITFVKDEPQIFLGPDRSFTFDYIFPPDASQAQVFETSVLPLLDRFTEGHNVTILAYGQTGSGKTYSMGTGIESVESQGIVQRFAMSLFHALERKQGEHQVYASFLELYHEELHDLLQPRRPDDGQPAIREDPQGNIQWAGIVQQETKDAEELLGCLRRGAAIRTTGSTDMNQQSSRSHAIFSVLLKQQHADQRLASKFHFVDLAGSERLKRTMGDRQKEGISINTGLLALGNVISALGDESRKSVHVPYRDSKLTRLLQDSLGGNSLTLMLACISPSDADMMKSLNTLQYALRARNIENRVEVNHDYEGSPEELEYLRNRVAQLKMQVSILQKVQNPPSQKPQANPYRQELISLQEYTQSLTAEMARIQSERDTLKVQLESAHPVTIDGAHPLIQSYVEKIRDLQRQLDEALHRIAQYQTPGASPRSSASETPMWDLGDFTTHVSTSQGLPGRFGQTRIAWRPHGTMSATRRKRRTVPFSHRMKTRSSPSKKKSPAFASIASSSSSSMDDFLHCRDQKATSTSIHDHLSRDETVAHMSPGGKVLKDHSPSHGSAASAAVASVASVVTPPKMSPKDLEDDDDDDDGLEALAVPTWTDVPRAQSTNGSTKRESLSWTDSLLDDSEHSVATSRLSAAATGITRDAATTRHRRSRDMLKMLHQIQADMLVKKELVGQLEKSEDEIHQMRVNYEDKLEELQQYLEATQKERDQALQQSSPVSRRISTPPAPSGGLQLREARQADEVRRLYESKIKKLTAEGLEWKRKYTQSNQTLKTARVKAESFVQKLKSEMEALKQEKKQLALAIKQETDKARDAATQYERELQQIRRREAAALEARKKAEEAQEAQAQHLKKKTDDVAAISSQMRQLMVNLRKAASEGLVLNEANLERIVSGTSPLGRRPTRTPTRSPALTTATATATTATTTTIPHDQ